MDESNKSGLDRVKAAIKAEADRLDANYYRMRQTSQCAEELEFMASECVGLNTAIEIIEKFQDEQEALPARTNDYENKYREVMEALRDSTRRHGNCTKRPDGQPEACTACMAALKLDALLKEYNDQPFTEFSTCDVVDDRIGVAIRKHLESEEQR